MDYSLSLIILAGGQGSRMGESRPKQFLPLQGKPLVFYSLQQLLALSHVECALVCDLSYRDLLAPFSSQIVFANPGKERMFSVFEGLKALSKPTEFVLVHDAARPLVQQEDLVRLLEACSYAKAATLATPVTSTIKQVDSDLYVQKTLPRETLWDIQTPQLIRYDLLNRGLQQLISQGKIVTDEMSIAEMLQEPVKIIPGSPLNLKVTTPKDLLLADLLLQKKDLCR